MFGHGVEKIEFLTGFGMTCNLYLRNATSLLRQQIKCILNTEIYFGSTPSGTRSHSMHAEVGVFACQAVEQHTKSTVRLELVWKHAEKDNVQSAIRCVQVFSDKS